MKPPPPACWKRAFNGPKSARRACRAMGERIRVYQCPRCRKWHVTHERRDDT